MAAIRCEGLYRSYGQLAALSDLNLEIAPGVVFGFLGKNGAGKTTTIRLFTGLAKPTAGETWVNGVRTSDNISGSRNNFGYLPETPAFYGWMTVGEFLTYVGKLYGIGGALLNKRIAELLELTGLSEATSRRISGFSKGMRQRLGLAQALIHKPPVLFLDEPTSALDPAGRRSVLDLIDRLRGDTTVFLSSHILGDVERVCDQIGVIEKGTLLLVADRNDLINRYASEVIALDYDPTSLGKVPVFLEKLEAMSWVDSTMQEGSRIKINVNDVQKAKASLLDVVSSSRLILDRYEWEKPSLEEIFLRISN